MINSDSLDMDPVLLTPSGALSGIEDDGSRIKLVRELIHTYDTVIPVAAGTIHFE